MSRATPLLVLLGVGCAEPPGSERIYDLGDAQLEISALGAVTLLYDERATFRMPPEIGLIARSYTEEPREHAPIGGIWEMRRSDEVSVELQPVGAPSIEGSSVVIGYASEDGSVGARLEVDLEESRRTRFRLALTGGSASSLAVPVLCDEESSFHGFGEQYNATDQRGEAFELFVGEQGLGRRGLRAISGDAHTTYFPMPYWLDARGFGVLFRTDHRVLVDLCRSDAGVAWVEVVGDEAEWVVFGGPTPLEVVQQLGEVVGRPTPLPDWAFGVWIASQGGRDAVLAEADALEAADIPFEALWVQDWTGIRMNLGGGFGVQYRWEADDELYPDLPGLVATLRTRGYRFLAYANPFVDPDLPNHFEELDASGLLVGAPEGGSYQFFAPNGMSGHPDLTNAAARAYVVAALRNMVDTYGFDGWMQDFGEWTPTDAVLSDGSDPLAYHNLFVVEWQRLAQEAMRAARPDGDYVVFGRSGWTGVQGASQAHWAGDQEASWSDTDGLPTVLPALLNLGLSGQFHVTHDIAGFSGGPSTKELFMRWTELGAFTPIMRTHEGNAKLENWSWETDAETTAHFRRMARVHLALRALFAELAAEAQSTSAPIVRHLLLQFPDDPEARAVDDQLMLGDALMIAPVTAEGVTRRAVYLPPGQWFDAWTGEQHAGGRTVELDAPLGSPPALWWQSDRDTLRSIE